ncbi:sarcocystatin-A [Stomoxys calcitrans]|uniref:Cystatin domain-containing protein n=1 Tax=Stomoxys calcitrans TaxID=35570 RepID=A0A1I8PTI7_STOCA|nr:sarcocystatin-A [Stomoxys calcitrans]
MKVWIFLGFCMAMAMASQPPISGGITSVRNLKEAEKELNASLAKLATGDGPRYRLVKIYSATRQVVAGRKSEIVADLVDNNGKTKKCNVTIWSRPWLPDGIEVTFRCDGEQKLTRKHSA